MLVEQLADHLEFYGYKIEKREPPEKGRPPLYMARAQSRPTLRFYEQAPYFVLFRSGFRSQRQPGEEMRDLFNRVNERMLVSRAYWEPLEPGPGIVVTFESTFIGGYKKDLFAMFYDMMLKDGRIIYDLADCDRLFISKPRPAAPSDPPAR